ncbi:hypothetical protein ABID95_004348 [Streptomyces atratus]
MAGREASQADELGLTVFWSGIGSSDILREARAACFPTLRRPTEATAPIRQRSVPTPSGLPLRCKEHPDEWGLIEVSGGRAGAALHLAIRRHGRLGRPHGWVSPA